MGVYFLIYFLYSARQELLEAKLDSVLVKLENLANNLRIK
jgi:hypothetical protein